MSKDYKAEVDAIMARPRPKPRTFMRHVSVKPQQYRSAGPGRQRKQQIRLAKPSLKAVARGDSLNDTGWYDPSTGLPTSDPVIEAYDDFDVIEPFE